MATFRGLTPDEVEALTPLAQEVRASILTSMREGWPGVEIRCEDEKKARYALHKAREHIAAYNIGDQYVAHRRGTNVLFYHLSIVQSVVREFS